MSNDSKDQNQYPNGEQGSDLSKTITYPTGNDNAQSANEAGQSANGNMAVDMVPNVQGAQGNYDYNAEAVSAGARDSRLLNDGSEASGSPALDSELNEAKEGASEDQAKDTLQAQGEGSKAPGDSEAVAEADPATPEAARERMDVENHPDVVSGEVAMDSELDKEFNELYEERVVLPRHEMQDGVRNKENRAAIKDAGIKRKGFNNDLHKLNIERVVSAKGGDAVKERNAKSQAHKGSKSQEKRLASQSEKK